MCSIVFSETAYGRREKHKWESSEGLSSCSRCVMKITTGIWPQSCCGLTHRLVTIWSAVPLAALDIETACTHSSACLAQGLQLGRSLSHCVRKKIVRAEVCMPVCPFKGDGVSLASKSDGLIHLNFPLVTCLASWQPWECHFTGHFRRQCGEKRDAPRLDQAENRWPALF